MANENQIVVKVKIAAETSQLASDTLREIDGVDRVEPMTPQCLRVTYDINQTSWAAIRDSLHTIGAYSQAGLLARWRDGWREFKEQNIRDNLRHTPACCSKAPAGGGMRTRASHDRR